MTFEFTLCPRCHGKYLALRFDSKSKYDVDPMPFHSLVWRDEHPDEIGYFLTCCAPCQESVRLLAYARTHLWRHGDIPAAFAGLWTAAQSTIPDWPGFKRLALDKQQMRDLEMCRGELEIASDAALDKSRLLKASKFAQRLEERRSSVPGLVRPGSLSNLGLDASGKSKVIRCPKCKEFVDASATKCRFCNSLLDSKEIETAVAQRAQEKVFTDRKEVARLKVSGWLGLAALGILLFVPAAGPVAGAVKWGVVLLLIGLSLANRLR
jgi:hypothetical protein